MARRTPTAREHNPTMPPDVVNPQATLSTYSDVTRLGDGLYLGIRGHQAHEGAPWPHGRLNPHDALGTAVWSTSHVAGIARPPEPDHDPTYQTPAQSDIPFVRSQSDAGIARSAAFIDAGLTNTTELAATKDPSVGFASSLSACGEVSSSIDSALYDDADILPYGRNVASGSDGQAFMEQLATLTGITDDAGSDSRTGLSLLSGYADLEARFGGLSATPLLPQAELNDLRVLSEHAIFDGSDNSNASHNVDGGHVSQFVTASDEGVAVIGHTSADARQLKQAGMATSDPNPNGLPVELSSQNISTATTFDIDITYKGDALYQSIIESAAARWEQIITADIPSVISGLYGTIDDLLVNVTIATIDGIGGILGQGGPDEIRSSNYLPDHGFIEFDSADVAWMFSNGTLLDVATHEIGHVLGIGSLWETFGLLSGFDYVGAHAVAEYAALTGNPSVTSIPVENVGGAGSVRSHWRESVFDTELMTSVAEAPGVPMPLSRMTIGSLQDLGYTVDYTAADPYQPFMLPTTVIEAIGATDLTQVGSNYYLYAHGTTTGPTVKFLGIDYVAGQFGAWTPLGAEAAGGGYQVAWKDNATGHYTVWQTDSSGNYLSNVVPVVTGSRPRPADDRDQLRPGPQRRWRHRPQHPHDSDRVDRGDRPDRGRQQLLPLCARHHDRPDGEVPGYRLRRGAVRRLDPARRGGGGRRLSGRLEGQRHRPLHGVANRQQRQLPLQRRARRDRKPTPPCR